MAGAGGDGVLYFAGLYVLSERKAALLRTACACFASLYVWVLARAASAQVCVFCRSIRTVNLMVRDMMHDA